MRSRRGRPDEVYTLWIKQSTEAHSNIAKHLDEMLQMRITLSYV